MGKAGGRGGGEGGKREGGEREGDSDMKVTALPVPLLI